MKKYKVVAVSGLVGARNMLTIASNLTEEEANKIIKNAVDKDFYSYYKVEIN